MGWWNGPRGCNRQSVNNLEYNQGNVRITVKRWENLATAKTWKKREEKEQGSNPDRPAPKTSPGWSWDQNQKVDVVMEPAPNTEGGETEAGNASVKTPTAGPNGSHLMDVTAETSGQCGYMAMAVMIAIKKD